MTKDRLLALKAAGVSVGLDQDEIHIDMNTSVFMEEFFVKVMDVRTNIQAIQKYIMDVKQLHHSVLSAPTPDDKINNELEERMSEVKITAQKVRAKLKEIEHDSGDISLDPHLAESRIKKGQFSFLSHLFTDVMASYNSVQIEHRDQCKKRIQRQLEITGKPTSDEEIERMLESGNMQIFSESYLNETKMAKQTLADINARHKDILKLEKSILELHDMFMDMAMLVESQGEMIDNIEKNITSTVDFVESAKVDTKKAVENKRAAMKKKIIIIIIGVVVVVVLIIILVVVLLKYTQTNSSSTSNTPG
jgi:t-SNARE complex subunit (syntaxin)